jgi:hypothetical protein
MQFIWLATEIHHFANSVNWRDFTAHKLCVFCEEGNYFVRNLDESNGSEWCIKGKNNNKKFFLKDEAVTKPAVSVLFILVSPFIRSKYLPITAHLLQTGYPPVHSSVLHIFPP